jgi:hypothetical protein
MTAIPLVVGCALAAAASSCVVTYADYAHHQGTLTLRWSIDGHREAASCTALGATYTHVVVRHDRDGVATDDLFKCAAFSASYVLDEGWYDFVVGLEDGARKPVSDTRVTSPVYVSADAETFVSIDLTTPLPP